MPPYSQLVIHGDGPGYYDARNVPHGAVTRHIYHSTVLNGEREIFVYTPPGYEKARAKLPVLYLLHGAGDEQEHDSRDAGPGEAGAHRGLPFNVVRGIAPVGSASGPPGRWAIP